MPKILRITTISLSLEKLLSGQLPFMESKGMEMHTASHGAYNFKNHTELTHLCRAINPVQDVLALFQLIALIRTLKPEIVHTHTPKAGLLGMCAAWVCRVPVRMHTVAGLPLMEKRGMLKKLLIVMERITYFFSNGVYPNSKGLLGFIYQNISQSDKIKIIGKGTSNGISLSIFNPNQVTDATIAQLKEELNITTELVYLFIGRMVRDKGIVELVRSFQKLHVNNKSSKLLMVGPLEQDLDPLPQDVLDAIQNHSAIISLGYQEDVRPYIAMSDVLVFPSYREGFPNVPMQCGAFKKALILSDINGCDEIVEHEKNGLLVKAKDSDGLYDAMRFMLENPDERIRFGNEAYKHIKYSFDQKEVWNAILEEYQLQMMKGHHV
ncbi:glycosyltransferase family 4 protein [bacterium]|nr:glycosyltransferase family 4 protein [bacterium]